jgi:hypothetical protein
VTRERLSSSAWLAWIAAMLVTPGVTLWLIARHAVNVPISDDWSLVPLFAERDAGTLSLGDLVAQHFEHVPVIPRAADLFMAPLTKWDLRVEMYRNFGVALATLAVIVVALRRSLRDARLVIASVLASLLVFSPVQYENWIWGWQLEWFLSNLAAITAFYALAFVVDRSPRRGIAIATLAAFVATFSLGQGLLVWPLGLAILVLRGRPWRVWAGAAVVAWGLYFAGWHNPDELGSKTRSLDLPRQTADYVLQYLGGALGTGNAVARIAGVALLAAFAAAAVAVLRRRDGELLRRASTWLALGAYALGSAMLTAISRVDETVDVLSRYSVMGGLFALATVALVYVVLPQTRPQVVLAVAAPVLVAGALTVRAGGDQLGVRASGHQIFATCLRTITSPRDPCAPQLSPSERALLQREIDLHWRYVAYLRRKGWAGF